MAQNPETKIQTAISKALRMDGWRVDRNQQGLGCTPGRADLEALKNGKTVYIEVKTETGRLSGHQKDYEVDIKLHGGEYIVARSVDDIAHLLGQTRLI